MNSAEQVIPKRIDSLLVKKSSAYLSCPACNLLFLRPVISIKCGHTFCEDCTQSVPGNGIVRCPVDGEICDSKALITNRAIQDQIEDLEIKCPFYKGRLSSVDEKSDGCKEIMKYGKLLEHQKVCDYVLVDCQNGSDSCGKIRRKDAKLHQNDCKFNPCKFSNEGCDCKDIKTNVELHEKSCEFQFSGESLSTDKQIEILRTVQKNMIVKVNELTDRLKSIESLLALSLKNKSSNSKEMYPIIESSDLVSIEEFGHEADAFSGKHHSITSRSVKFVDEELWVMPFQFKCIGTIRCHQHAVTSVCLWNQCVFTSDTGANIKMWGLNIIQEGSLMTLIGGRKKINAMIISVDQLYAAGDDMEIKCWNLYSLEQVAIVVGAHEKSIIALVSSNGLLFSSSYTIVKVWQCLTLDHVHTITGFHHWVRALATNALCDKVYTGSHGTIDIWSTVAPFHSKGQISQPIGSVHSLGITKQFIIAGTYNKNIFLYDVKSLQPVHHFTGHVGIVSCIVSSPSQKFIVTGSSDTTTLLWCLEKKLPIQAMQRHDAAITCAAVFNDILLTGSEDKEIKIFRQSKC